MLAALLVLTPPVSRISFEREITRGWLCGGCRESLLRWFFGRGVLVSPASRRRTKPRCSVKALV